MISQLLKFVVLFKMGKRRSNSYQKMSEKQLPYFFNYFFSPVFVSDSEKIAVRLCANRWWLSCSKCLPSSRPYWASGWTTRRWSRCVTYAVLPPPPRWILVTLFPLLSAHKWVEWIPRVLLRRCAPSLRSRSRRCCTTLPPWSRSWAKCWDRCTAPSPKPRPSTSHDR